MAGNHIDDIISNIDRATGDNLSSDETLGTETVVSEEGSIEEEGSGNAAEAAQPSEQQSTPQQQTKPQQQAEAKKPESRARSDANGNLLDANGNVIATAGVQRRLHEQNERMRGILSDRDREINDLKVQVRAGQVLNGIPQQLGITNEESFEMLKLGAMFKSDPVGAARTVVAKALEKGHNLEDILGEQSAGQVQMDAIRGMIDDRLAPLTKEREDNRRQAEAQAEAQRTWNEFLVRYPAAELHNDVLANIMREDPRGSQDHPAVIAERAYLRLESFCARNGLDINSPLNEQIKALQQRSQPQVPTSLQRRQNAPMPSPSNQRSAQVAQPVRSPLSGNASWREIIESVKADLAGGNG